MRSFHIFNNVTGAFGGVSFKSKLSAIIRIVIYGLGYPFCKVSGMGKNAKEIPRRGTRTHHLDYGSFYSMCHNQLHNP